MFDTIIKGAQVIDGTGAPAFRADVAIKDGRLTVLPGGSEGLAATSVIDAAGKYVCPGFIDAHSHGDLVLGRDYAHLCKTAQGITTELAGQCGNSEFPTPTDPYLYQRHVDDVPKVGELGHNVTDTFAQYRAYMERTPKTAHIKQYVGHGPLRRAVMGTENREPTRAELDSMKAMLREAMENGALGMTTGLIYPPGGFSKQDELTELCKVVAEYNGVYATHMREEGDLVVESVREAIETAGDAGCRLCISHHKVCGHKNWGKSRETLALIDAANAAGQEVAFDVYPYTASMTSLSACLPLTEFVYPREERVARLRDPETRALIRGQMERGEVLKFSQLTGFDKILLVYFHKTPQFCGKTIAQVAEELGVDPYDVFFDILADNNYIGSSCFFTMCDDDLCNIFCHDRAMLGTDGLVYAMNTPTHPRGFCSFPHAIDFFVKQKKLLSLEAAIRKMTGFTADWLHVQNKGYVKDGYDADLVILDYDTVAGGFTYAQPVTLNPGIEQVLVDGVTVFKNGALTGKTPGRVLLHGM